MTATRPEKPDYSKPSLIKVLDQHEGQRLDNYLLRELKGVPRSHIYRIMRKGEVRVNKKRCKPITRLQANDEIRLPPIRLGQSRDTATISPSRLEQLQSQIIYEDGDVILLNKPAGLAVHGGSGIEYGVIEAFRQMRPELPALDLVHRLDRGTSGCLLMAKKASVLKQLHASLREGAMNKIYHALVIGKWPSKLVIADQPLCKDAQQGGERVVRVDREGKEALTHFRVVKRLAGHTLIEARPITGRTHQIRVHCSCHEHPIVADHKYGWRREKEGAVKLRDNQLFLHAVSLTFQLDSWPQPLRITAPYPDTFEAAIDVLDN